jgi:hypothetical protein
VTPTSFLTQVRTAVDDISRALEDIFQPVIPVWLYYATWGVVWALWVAAGISWLATR